MTAIEPWRCLDSRVALRAKTFLVRRDRAALPGGSGEPVEYNYLEQRNSVIVLPLRDDGALLMVEQYRYPVRRVMLEFPSGALADGEPPERGARRELAEEVGVNAEAICPLGALHQAASLTTAEVFVFLARGLRPGETKREATEQMVVRAVPLGDVERLIADGTIDGAVTIASYYLAQQWRKQQEAASGV